jgi:hypothetical protein
LEALPLDLRAEVLSSYGLTESDVASLPKESRPNKRLRPGDTAPSEPDRDPIEVDWIDQDPPPEQVPSEDGPPDDGLDDSRSWDVQELDDYDDTRAELDAEFGTSDEEADRRDRGRAGTSPCPVCGLELFPFAAAAHALYHDNDA